MSCPDVSPVRSCLLMLFIHMSAPVEAKRVPGAPAQTRRAHLQPPGEAESIPLDLTPMKAKADDFLAQLENLTQSLYTCSSQKLDEDMRLQFLKNDTVTCNDGSPAGWVNGRACDLFIFYLLPSKLTAWNTEDNGDFRNARKRSWYKGQELNI